MVHIGARRKDVVAITAAMMHPVGLDKFQARYPERTFDVGIAEQHAATSAAGLAMGGLHPVVAIYATFLNRAFDQVLMDVALHRCGVTFVLDRAGVTGEDGASHNGMWDMSILQVVPGLRLAAPRDGTRLRELLNEAVDVDDAPTVVRFSKGPPPADIPAIGKAGGADVLARNGTKDVLVVAIGSMAVVAVDVAERLVAQGIGVTVVDPRWVKPVDPAIVTLAREHRLVVSVEDNGRTGGCGAVLLQTLNDAGVTTPFRLHGIPQEFLSHAKRAAILERIGLTSQTIARGIVEDLVLQPDVVARRLGSEVLMSSTRAEPPPPLFRFSVGVVLALTLAFTLVGCSEPAASPEPDAAATEAGQGIPIPPDLDEAFTATLEERAGALVDRDQAEFLTGIDRGQRRLRHRAARLLRQPGPAAGGTIRL